MVALLARLGSCDPWTVLTWSPSRLRFNLDILESYLAHADMRVSQINGQGMQVLPAYLIQGL